jgi:hypothetical protein
MFKRSYKSCLLIAITALLITSCAAPQVILPTPDLNLVRTEAVVTALAQLTKEAALIQNPTKTKVVSKTTPLTTTTPYVVTATPSINSGGGTTGGGSGSGGSSGVIVPTWTPVIYGAQFITQDPLDGYPCPTGELIDYKVILKNTGAATWDHTSYYYRLKFNWTGRFPTDVELTEKDQYMLPIDVPSGSKVTLVIDIQCPAYPDPEAWTTEWRLVNDNGAEFARFFFRFYTVVHGVPTPTRANTPAPG